MSKSNRQSGSPRAKHQKTSNSSSSQSGCNRSDGGMPSYNAKLSPVQLSIQETASLSMLSHDVNVDVDLVRKACVYTLKNFQCQINKWVALCNSRNDWSLDNQPPGPPILSDHGGDEWKVTLILAQKQPDDPMQGWNLNKFVRVECLKCKTAVDLVDDPTNQLYNHCFNCKATQYVTFYRTYDLTV